MDISDRATQQEELAREEALRQIRLPENPAATSLLYCVDCGARIPKRRRLAVPGCTRCVGCQAYQSEELEKTVNSLKETLPLNYVLREDYIRGQAVLEAKMDALHKTISDLYKLESGKK